MPFLNFFWTDDAVEHIAEHGILEEDFEQVVCRPDSRGFSRSSRAASRVGLYGRRSLHHGGVRGTGTKLTVRPVTAYEVPEPR